MSEFTYRWCINEDDYLVVCNMMSEWGMPQIHRRMLSEYGAIISRNGVDICSGWLYQSDSKIAWIEWVIMSKKAPKELRKGAIEFMYNILFETAKKLHYEVIMCAVKNNFLIETLTNKLGFIEDKEGGNQKLFFKNLWQL
jgi:hypothetical protein